MLSKLVIVTSDGSLTIHFESIESDLDFEKVLIAFGVVSDTLVGYSKSKHMLVSFDENTVNILSCLGKYWGISNDAYVLISNMGVFSTFTGEIKQGNFTVDGDYFRIPSYGYFKINNKRKLIKMLMKIA